MEWVRVRNWDKWQTYRTDRSAPPWIKVHRALLRDPQWIDLSDAAKGHLVSIWMLAADHGGSIPADPSMVARLCFLTVTPDLAELVERGFLEPSDSIQKAPQGDATHDATLTPPMPQVDATYDVSEQSRSEQRRGEQSREEHPPSACGTEAVPPSEHPLIRLLTALPGCDPPPEQDEREAWIETYADEVEAAADAELPESASAKQRSAKVVSITRARWRVYLAGPRRFRGIAHRLERDRIKAEWAAQHGEAHDRELAEVGSL